MPLTRLDHYNIRTDDIAATLHFYVDVLGLHQGFRPPFRSRGAWLYIGDHPVVHVVDTDTVAAAGSGRVDHMAFFADEIDSVRSRIAAAGYPYEMRDVPDQALRQIFLRDPNGVLVELNFAI